MICGQYFFGGFFLEEFDSTDWVVEHPPVYHGFSKKQPAQVALPHQVCPRGDSPLSWWHYMGWSVMHQRLWPLAPLQNPILYYLGGKRWRAKLWDLVGMLPWLVVLAIEGGMIYYCYQMQNLFYWFLLVLAEILVLPFIIVPWSQLMLVNHFFTLKKRIHLDEINVTLISADELVSGFALRPITAQIGGCFLFGILSFIGIFYIGQEVFLSNTLIGAFWMLPILVGLLYRTYYLKWCIEFGSVLALRSCLFIPDPFQVITRAIRDWIYPWAFLIPMLLAVVIGVQFLADLASLLVFVNIVLVLLSLFVVYVIPSLLKTYTEEIHYWMNYRFGRWSMQTGERHPTVPKNLFRRWSMERGWDKKRDRNIH